MPQQIPVTPVLLLLEPSAQQLDGAFEKLKLAQRFPALPRGSVANRAPQVTDWPGQYRAMLVAIDLAIMKIKSLKRYLAEMAEMPEAIEQVARAVCEWNRREPGALQAKQQHDQYMRSLAATAALTGRPPGDTPTTPSPAVDVGSQQGAQAEGVAASNRHRSFRRSR